MTFAPPGTAKRNKIEVDKKFLDQILQAAAATALGSAFRAPMGGVLFSVEVTAASYRVSNYAKGFFAAVFGATLVYLIADLDQGYRWSLAQDSDVTRSFGKAEVVVFMLMGAVCGLMASLFVFCYTRIRAFHAWFKPIVFGKDWKTEAPLRAGALFCVVVGGTTAVLQYAQGQYMTEGLRASVSDLWTEADLRAGEHPGIKIRADNWGEFGSPIYAEMCYAITVFSCCVATITLPVVAGLFTPTIAVGAALGRIVGEIMYGLFPEANISRSGYAYVGAAAFSGGCTQTISTAIAVIEMTGELDFAIPMLLAVVISVLVAKKIGSSIFDRITKLNSLPNIIIPRCDITNKAATDVMLWPNALPVNVKLGQIAYCLIRDIDPGSDGDNERALAALGITKSYSKDFEHCDPQLSSDRRDETICIVEKLPNIQLIGMASRSQLVELLVTELKRALRDINLAIASGLPTRETPASAASTDNLSPPARGTSESLPSSKSAGSTLQVSLQKRLSNIRKGVADAKEALKADNKDQEVQRMIDLLREYREQFQKGQTRAAAEPGKYPGPTDVLRRTVALDNLEGCPDLGTNLITKTPRIPVTEPLSDVINFMLTRPTQFAMVYDLDGRLLGQITVEHLNRKLTEWRQQEKADERSISDAARRGTAGGFHVVERALGRPLSVNEEQDDSGPDTDGGDSTGTALITPPRRPTARDIFAVSSVVETDTVPEEEPGPIASVAGTTRDAVESTV